MGRRRKREVGRWNVEGDRHRPTDPVHPPNFGDYQVNKMRASVPFDRHALAGDSCLLDHVRSCDRIKTPQGRCDGERISGSLGVRSTADSMISTDGQNDMANEQQKRRWKTNEPPCKLFVECLLRETLSVRERSRLELVR